MAQGTLPLRISAYTHVVDLPDELVTSVRCQVRVGDEVLVCTNADGISHPAVLMWHEIVNDDIAGRPVAVTYCPLCNSGVAYGRRVDGRTLDFGTSGSLYLSALVMYDRQTESLWTRFDGTAVVGTLVGTELARLPTAMDSWADLRTDHPDTIVLSKQTGYERPYGRNAYQGYDQDDGPLPGFFPGRVDPRQAGMARVVGFGDGDGAVAVLTEHLARIGVAHLELDGRPIVAGTCPAPRRRCTATESPTATMSAPPACSSPTARRSHATEPSWWTRPRARGGTSSAKR